VCLPNVKDVNLLFFFGESDVNSNYLTFQPLLIVEFEILLNYCHRRYGALVVSALPFETRSLASGTSGDWGIG